MTPRQVALLSGIGLFLGLVLLLAGYSRYYSVCFPNGPVVSISCNYPSQPIDVAIDSAAITLLLISGALLLVSVFRPSAFKGEAKKAAGKRKHKT